MEKGRLESEQLMLNWTALDLSRFVSELTERLSGGVEMARIRLEVPED